MGDMSPIHVLIGLHPQQEVNFNVAGKLKRRRLYYSSTQVLDVQQFYTFHTTHPYETVVLASNHNLD